MYSTSGYKGPSLCRVRNRCNRLNLKCYYVNKLYGGNFEVFLVYSKIRQRLKQDLGIILFESGIRMFWLSIYKKWDSIVQNVKFQEVTEAVVVKELSVQDELVSALFQVLMILLAGSAGPVVCLLFCLRDPIF